MLFEYNLCASSFPSMVWACVFLEKARIIEEAKAAEVGRKKAAAEAREAAAEARRKVELEREAARQALEKVKVETLSEIIL